MVVNLLKKLAEWVIGAGIIFEIIKFFFGDWFLKIGNKIRFWFNNNLPGNLKPKFIDVNSQTNINIRNSKITIKGLNQLQRFEVDEIKKAWNGGINGLLLVGEAGTGKSGIAAILARELQKENYFVLFLSADEIRDPIDCFRKDYFQGKSIFTFLRELTEFKECYILFDQLDSVQNSDQLKDIGIFLQELSTLPKVRVLGVSRIYEADNLQEIKNLQFQRISSDSLSKDDAKKYLKRLEIFNPSEDLVELSRNLLNLSLIAQVEGFGKDATGITEELELWELFLTTIQEREGNEAWNLLVDMAILDAENKFIKLSMSQEHLPGIYGRLKSRQLLLPAGGRKYRFFHQKFRDFLCAKKLMSEDYRPADYLERFGFSNGANIINWVLALYRKDGPSVEDDFIQQIIEDECLPFYVRAAIFDSYLEKPLIDLNNQLVRNIFSNQDYEKYFFTNLNSPKWVDYFKDIGFFLNAPDPMPVPRQPGYIQFPRWHAGEYLKEMASQFPEIVKDTALNLKTKNPRAIKTLLEAILNIPPDLAAQTVSVYEQWANSYYASSLLLICEMGQIIEFLANAGQENAALEVLNIVTKPVESVAQIDGGIEAIFQNESYWMKQILFTRMLPLVELKPLEAVSILENHLKNGIDLEVRLRVADNKSSSYWRTNINPNIEGYSHEDFKDLIVTAIIKTLFSACDNNVDGVEIVLGNYLNSEYEILRRVAVHVLRVKGDKFVELLPETYREMESKPFVNFRNEIRLFYYDQFRNFPPDIQRKILDLIYSEQSKKKYIEHIENHLDTHFDQMEGETREDKKQIYLEKSLLDRLGPIAEHLTEEDKKIYEELYTKYGEPVSPVERGVITTWSGPNSPYKEGELLEKSVQEIIDILLTYVPEEDRFGGAPSRAGLGRDLQKVVASRSDEFAQNAVLFINGNIRSGYYDYYFSGLEEALKNDQIFSFGEVIQLAQYICEKSEDKYQLDDLESSIETAKISIASFFVKVFTVDVIELNEHDLSIVEKIIQKLVWVDEEYDRLLRTPEEIAEENPYDSSTKSLNTIRGEAMHALIRLELYKARVRGEEMGEDNSPIFDEWAKVIIVEKLDKTQDTSLAVHSVIGQYVPQLMYLDKDWTIEETVRKSV